MVTTRVVGRHPSGSWARVRVTVSRVDRKHEARRNGQFGWAKATGAAAALVLVIGLLCGTVWALPSACQPLNAFPIRLVRVPGPRCTCGLICGIPISIQSRFSGGSEHLLPWIRFGIEPAEYAEDSVTEGAPVRRCLTIALAFADLVEYQRHAALAGITALRVYLRGEVEHDSRSPRVLSLRVEPRILHGTRPAVAPASINQLVAARALVFHEIHRINGVTDGSRQLIGSRMIGHREEDQVIVVTRENAHVRFSISFLMRFLGFGAVVSESVDETESNGGDDEGHVDDGLPEHHGLLTDGDVMLGLDEGLEQMDR